MTQRQRREDRRKRERGREGGRKREREGGGREGVIISWLLKYYRY